MAFVGGLYQTMIMILNLMNSSCTTASDSLSCLRSANTTDLQTINYNIDYDGFYGTFVFVPVIDGTFIVESPTITLLKGKHNAVSDL
jgi:acetylcholinesterase